MHQPLLVVALDEAQTRASVLQGLAQTRDIAVSENAQHPLHEFVFRVVEFHILRVQKTQQGLSHGQSRCSHFLFLSDVMLLLFYCWFTIHSCSGAFLKCHTRFGPAITLR